MDETRPVLLVIDDEPGIITMVERFAGGRGFDVIARAGGRQMLTELSALKADVALVDLRLPEVGGLDVLRAIRDADSACQVILMTAHATVDSAIEAVKLGALDYLSKPFDFDRLGELLATVRSMLPATYRTLRSGLVARIRLTISSLWHPSPQRGTETILLVEDEIRVRQLCARILAQHGYLALEAGSGEEALRVYHSHDGAIDLVLTDMVMPGMSDYVLAQTLWRLRPGLKVLWMSGYTDHVVFDVLKRNDETVLLPKPFKAAQLVTTVRSVLDRDDSPTLSDIRAVSTALCPTTGVPDNSFRDQQSASAA